MPNPGSKYLVITFQLFCLTPMVGVTGGELSQPSHLTAGADITNGMLSQPSHLTPDQTSLMESCHSPPISHQWQTLLMEHNNLNLRSSMPCSKEPLPTFLRQESSLSRVKGIQEPVHRKPQSWNYLNNKIHEDMITL